MPSPVPAPMRDATATRRGLMGVVAQTFSGLKTFLDPIRLALRTTATMPTGGEEMEGCVAFDTTKKELQAHDGTSWKSVGKTVDGTTVSLEGHTHTFASLTTKPTTRAGYGITDAASADHLHDDRYYTEAESDTRFQLASQRNQPNGYPGLDSSGKILSTQLPAIAVTDTFVVGNQASMLALTAEVGDIAVRTDLNKSYILQSLPPTTLANWQELLASTDSLASSLASSSGTTMVGGAAKTGMTWFNLAAGTLKAQLEELLTHINTSRSAVDTGVLRTWVVLTTVGGGANPILENQRNVSSAVNEGSLYVRVYFTYPLANDKYAIHFGRSPTGHYFEWVNKTTTYVDIRGFQTSGTVIPIGSACELSGMTIEFLMAGSQ